MSIAQANAPADDPTNTGTADGGVDASQPETTASVAGDGPCVDGWDNAVAFAARHGVTRGTVLTWAGRGRIPGAVKVWVRLVIVNSWGERTTQARLVWRFPPGAQVAPGVGRGRGPHVEPGRPAGTLTAHEVAAATGKSPDWVQDQAHKGRLPHGRAHGRYTFTPDAVDLIRDGLPDDPRTPQEKHLLAIADQHRRILIARFHAPDCAQDGGTRRHRMNGFACAKCAKLRSTMDKSGNRDWTHLQ